MPTHKTGLSFVLLWATDKKNKKKTEMDPGGTGVPNSLLDTESDFWSPHPHPTPPNPLPPPTGLLRCSNYNFFFSLKVWQRCVIIISTF